ncbi:serine/threonine protein kinase [Planktothrix agardhii CCAP 1459/11A]|jgi:serine/threonine-protein kinase|uniref:Serine/threonine protein kinase n=1 Tax=Planktothrix agardhii CCAP 1459/11A TaxID=282420 RepID=A0A4P5ZT22_PLAAG|nr:ARC6/PARC6 family protein [Planktothrix agardhii]GDZ93065.1 serine/threonine protein kinase [Planktothrix agardhii CCAP 1459/11A]CAD5979512.1 hypothetical protein NO108_04843 [Planktothrix rubescens]
MDDSTEKQKLWKIYGILMGVMVGGAVLILGGQAAWNTIQQNLAKSNTPSNSTTQSLTSTPNNITPSPQSAASNTLTQEEAVNLIERYLQAKEKIFAPPFDRQLAASLTTDTVYNDIVKPGGSIEWLQQNNAYYHYGRRSVQGTGYFSATDNKAEVEVSIEQVVYFYSNETLNKSTTDSSIYRFTLKQENGNWKISERSEKNQ